jgi:hypothetical protein
MKYLSYLLLTFLPFCLKAQTGWSTTYGQSTTNFFSKVSDATTIGDSTYLLVGNDVNEFQSAKISMMLIDTLGKLIWTKKYGNDDGNYRVYRVARYNPETLVIVGSISGINNASNGFVLYINNAGDSLDLQRLYDNSSVYDVFVEGENLILAINYYSYFSLRKQDRQGNLIWVDFDQYPTNSVAVNSIVTTTDGSFLAVGSRQGPGAAGGSGTGIFYKVNKLGQKEWIYFLNETIYKYSFSTIKASNDGNYLICGHWWWNSDSGTLLLKVDDQGNVIWRKKYAVETARAQLTDMVVLPNDEIVACGSYDASIVKFSSDGSLIWSKQFDPSSGTDRLGQMIHTPDNGYLAVGDVLGSNTSSGWALKICDQPDCIPTSSPELEALSGLTIYPNPVRSELNIASEGAQINNLVLLDAQGRETYRAGTDATNELNIHMSDFPNGVYFVTIRLNDQMLHRKIVKVE